MRSARAIVDTMVGNATVPIGMVVSVVEGGPDSQRCLVEIASGERDWVDVSNLDFLLGPTTTMRSGTGLTREELVGTVVVDSELNEVVLELEKPEGERTRLTCGGLIPLDFKGKRCLVVIEQITPAGL